MADERFLDLSEVGVHVGGSAPGLVVAREVSWQLLQLLSLGVLKYYYFKGTLQDSRPSVPL
jgi:hypothetical protein